MFTSVKNKVQKSSLIELLKFIVAATLVEPNHAFAPLAESEKLAKAEPDFIVIDKTVTNEQKQVKVTATQKAIDALTALSTPAATDAAASDTQAPAAMEYERVSLDELPEVRRGGHKSESYPFDRLKTKEDNDGKFDAFFVPVTTARPKPSKSMASTVASANKRYKDGRKFTLRKKVDTNGVELGAYVIREK